jgi:two-component system, chemotaxis family, protein-glutamate methylesterase/glutaminase
MSQIKVLIIDDAILFRAAISEAVREDAEIEVIGTAANGRLGLQKMAHQLPDLVILDFEMPELDGLGTVREIRKIWPRLPIIMCSSHTTEGARVTLQALELGANDFVAKPNAKSSSDAIAILRRELVPRIKTLGHQAQTAAHSQSGGYSISPDTAHDKVTRKSVDTNSFPAQKIPSTSSAIRHAPMRSGQIDLIVMGVSTGGPPALQQIIPYLPKDLPAPMVIVQHMPEVFTRLLAESLGAKSQVMVAEARAGVMAKPGQVWIAPGGHHVTVSRVNDEIRLDLNNDPPENSCRPAVDVLFRSAAKTCAQKTLAVMLTGMGEDGLQGCKLLHDQGAQIIVQDKKTSVVWGMPGAVARAGYAEQQLPLNEIAHEIVQRLKKGHLFFHSDVLKAPRT